MLVDWDKYLSITDRHYGTELENPEFGDKCAVGVTRDGLWFYGVVAHLNSGEAFQFETKEDLIESLKTEAFLPFKVIEELLNALEVL